MGTGPSIPLIEVCAFSLGGSCVHAAGGTPRLGAFFGCLRWVVAGHMRNLKKVHIPQRELSALMLDRLLGTSIRLGALHTGAVNALHQSRKLFL
jgi:hypothetical protein